MKCCIWGQSTSHLKRIASNLSIWVRRHCRMQHSGTLIPHICIEAIVELNSPSGVHEVIEQFGIRKFEVRGPAFYLNGEKVSLIGVERMAGSHPELGFAETAEWIDSNHRDMKNLNCVFTRVHWPQDRRVLDFCDRHGILMQEEVPAWGPETFSKTSDDVQHALEQNGLEQLREMIRRDRNHPCIVAWGLCNEVDGKNPRSRQFAHAISAEARRPRSFATSNLCVPHAGERSRRRHGW